MRLLYSQFASPIGVLTLISAGNGLRALRMESSGNSEAPPGAVCDDGAFASARLQLEDYFTGNRQTFALELDLDGTVFQKRVWEELRRIPYGATISYRELASRIGNPGASRAVGLANGRNPVAIVVPCHRVIGADGSLTGFGGGLARKRFLLELEARRLATPRDGSPCFELAAIPACREALRDGLLKAAN